MKYFLIAIVSIVHTTLGHMLGFHDGLPHIAYGDRWWLYVFETIFYFGFWCLILSYAVKTQYHHDK